ncbi:2-amino-4-hydroxy-6-hydroxymethyldihydropteridinediphosphokinase [Sphingomonas guangdongensis]|uniref:2-amino-4-hydroxy-6-hydroxymethyldihydropteridine pyrophosphokinase n=1 Tax=Sphingomonas guangdongensis TaxID=1141890 RepID=A0A285QXW1_9SPHN|nr:2-amino-4-hydroxy-6-hydroxymethyldihydropteridine diphosphokinase [Sphingomonas guangdongensis]SOB86656.1 2-amino-4-hydroxy-6-hydroxymethyldihydropteridinediphosphokinase [Sphingomonas guangdongensis]
MGTTSYVIAIGSNRSGRAGPPPAQVRAALALLGGRASPVFASAPVGPSIRRYANAATLIDTDEPPDALLARLKGMEVAFGRRRGRRWGARVIDLDIVLWSGGICRTRALTIPHAAFRDRLFVLEPLVELVPDWRDPVSGLTVRQLRARLTARRPHPNRATGVGP